MSTEVRPRSRRSRTQWQQLIEAQLAGEQSQAAFCRDQGISVSSFQYWKRRLARTEANSVEVPDWLELPADLDRTRDGWEIELSLGEGVVLRLRRR